MLNTSPKQLYIQAKQDAYLGNLHAYIEESGLQPLVANAFYIAKQKQYDEVTGSQRLIGFIEI